MGEIEYSAQMAVTVLYKNFGVNCQIYKSLFCLFAPYLYDFFSTKHKRRYFEEKSMGLKQLWIPQKKERHGPNKWKEMNWGRVKEMPKFDFSLHWKGRTVIVFNCIISESSLTSK